MPWIDVTIKRLVKRDISFTFVLTNPRTVMSRFTTNGSEHMSRRYGEMPKFPIYLRSRTIAQIPTLLSLKRLKSFGHLSNHLKKDTFGITSLRENGILKTDSKVDWLQSLKQFFINVSYILIASLSLMALF